MMIHAFNWLFVNQPSWISNLSNLTSITTLGALVAWWQTHTCVEKRCVRWAKHPVAGTTYHTCSKKHTNVEVHDRLFATHAEKNPAAHELLNR
jgi:hypothetical protein